MLIFAIFETHHHAVHPLRGHRTPLEFRLGEALRAKILFAEGAYKKQLIKPKFERRREPENLRGYAFFALERSTHQPGTRSHEINYGVDISTLTQMIENGEL